MHRLATLVVALAFAAGATHAAAQDRIRMVRVHVDQRADQREEQTERFTRTLKIGSNGELHIGNVSGDITVSRAGGNEATVEVIKTARGRTAEDAKQSLGLVQVDISERAGRGEIRTRYPQWEEFRRNNRRNINVSVAFNVSAPAGTRLAINSVSGDISVKDITGDVQLESVSGSVRIANGGRVAAAKSVSGNVELIDTEIDGRLEVSSVSGSVVMRRLKARAVDANSVSGNVALQDVECDRVDAKTVSGDIEFAGPLARNGRYELGSHSGQVRVGIVGGTGFELEATSFSGSVQSDINITRDANDNSSRRGRRGTLRGVHGDGSAVLDLTTFSGNIVITRR